MLVSEDIKTLYITEQDLEDYRVISQFDLKSIGNTFGTAR